ncbi:MAG: HlyD family efflux transporter periplasmic adaptor subunit [Lachnospirales bacterium]
MSDDQRKVYKPYNKRGRNINTNISSEGDTRLTNTKRMSSIGNDKDLLHKNNGKNVKKTNSNYNNKGSRKHDYVKSSSFSFIFITFFSIVFLGIYVFAYIFTNVKNEKIDIMTLEAVDITKSDWVNGIIIRDEEVYKSTEPMINEYIHYSKLDRDRVKKNDVLATLLNDNNKVAQEEVNKDKEVLFSLQNYREEYLRFEEDIISIENNIKSAINNMNNDKYESLYSTKEYIDEEIKVRNQILLSDTRTALTNDIPDSEINEGEKIMALNSGIFSLSLDGNETIYTLETMGNIESKDIPATSTFEDKLMVEVTKEEDLFRVVKSNMWYIGAYFPKDKMITYKKDDRVSIFVDNNSQKTMKSRIFSMTEKDDLTYVIFEMQNNMLDYLEKRNIEIAMNSEYYNNIKIPNTAIVNKEMIVIPKDFLIDKSVIKKTENPVGSVAPVEVWGDLDDENVLIVKELSDIRIGDTLISTGENPKEHTIIDTEIISGVYIANDGTARFRKININDELSETDYTYIIPNANIKNEDRIVVNAADAVEDEVVNSKNAD